MPCPPLSTLRLTLQRQHVTQTATTKDGRPLNMRAITIITDPHSKTGSRATPRLLSCRQLKAPVCAAYTHTVCVTDKSHLGLSRVSDSEGGGVMTTQLQVRAHGVDRFHRAFLQSSLSMTSQTRITCVCLRDAARVDLRICRGAWAHVVRCGECRGCC